MWHRQGQRHIGDAAVGADAGHQRARAFCDPLNALVYARHGRELMG
jgi:hypothetical protein